MILNFKEIQEVAIIKHDHCHSLSSLYPIHPLFATNRGRQVLPHRKSRPSIWRSGFLILTCTKFWTNDLRERLHHLGDNQHK